MTGPVAISLLMMIGLLASGVIAGVFGALLGIGGGLIVVPILTLGFGFDIKIAIASSLVAVVASSTAAGSIYVGKGLANLRLGMLLEIATTVGGISGGWIGVYLSTTYISGFFSVLLVFTGVLVLRTKDNLKKSNSTTIESLVVAGQEDIGKLSGAYYDQYLKLLIPYKVVNTFLGSLISFFAGMVSGLLGVGGGFIKVPAMTLVMNVPMKVSAATSNLMIGVTAISSLFVYFAKGFVNPMIAAPVAIGVVCGALFGATFAQKVSPNLLRRIFALVLFIVALQMFLKATGVSFGR